MLTLLAIFVTAVAGTCARAQEVRINAGPVIPLSNDRVEASGIALITGTQILVAEDKAPGLVVVDATTGKIEATRLPVGTVASNLDWEGMAKVDGMYYVVGSNSSLYTFRYDDKTTKIMGVAETRIARPAEILEYPKFEVEGLAARKLDGQIEVSFGIREEASQRIRVYRAVVNDKQTLSLTPFFHFDAPKTQEVNWHLASIEYVPELCGFLVLTTTESRDNKFFGNKIWFVAEAYLPGAQPTATSTEVKAIGSRVLEEKMKAEGLAVLSYDSQKRSVKLAIVYDNDFSRTGSPGKIQIVNVSVTPSP